MRPIEEIAKSPKISNAQVEENLLMGVFRFNDGSFASIVVGAKEAGKCDHVSVSPFKHKHTPTWEQMCEVKDTCFDPEEEAYEIHPRKSEYVNMMTNCLHLWARTDGKSLLD